MQTCVHGLATIYNQSGRALYLFSTACRSPEEPVKRQTIWFTFHRSNFEPLVACLGRITDIIDNNKFEAVAIEDDGTPVPKCYCPWGSQSCLTFHDV